MPDTGEVRLETIQFDLGTVLKNAPERFELTAIHIFGSRRFRSGSLRSDIDLFFETDAFIKPRDLRDFIDATSPALDILLLQDGRATSATNESHIAYSSNADVLTETRAVCLWSRTGGQTSEAENFLVQEYADIPFEKTALPNIRVPLSLDRVRAALERQGLPAQPLIGENEEEIAQQLAELAASVATFKPDELSTRGQAKTSFIIEPGSEYDFQDLFWLATRPWLSMLKREQVEIVFDGQKKISDFSLANSRFIIEMKYAKDADDKREIAKALDGLKNFYAENANVRILVFVIYVRPEAGINRREWEDRYSSRFDGHRTIVRIVDLT